MVITIAVINCSHVHRLEIHSIVRTPILNTIVSLNYFVTILFSRSEEEFFHAEPKFYTSISYKRVLTFENNTGYEEVIYVSLRISYLFYNKKWFLQIKLLLFSIYLDSKVNGRERGCGRGYR